MKKIKKDLVFKILENEDEIIVPPSVKQKESGENNTSGQGPEERPSTNKEEKSDQS